MPQPLPQSLFREVKFITLKNLPCSSAPLPSRCHSHHVSVGEKTSGLKNPPQIPLSHPQTTTKTLLPSASSDVHAAELKMLLTLCPKQHRPLPTPKPRRPLSPRSQLQYALSHRRLWHFVSPEMAKLRPTPTHCICVGEHTLSRPRKFATLRKLRAAAAPSQPKTFRCKSRPHYGQN